jgi:Rps23 Pro-64 3,4-dihydroxylase Tpa1-like proline 4-hydroxylase
LDDVPVEYSLDQLWEKYDSCVASIDFLHIDEHIPKLKNLIRDFDEIWNGEGGTVVHARLTPAGVCPYSAYATEKDRIILQIEGSQEIIISKQQPEDIPGNPYSDIYSAIFSTIAILAEEDGSEKVMLKAGQLLYVPSSVVVCQNSTLSSSFSIEIMFSETTSWESLLQNILEESQKRLSLKETNRVMNPEISILAQSKEVLETSLTISNEVYDTFSILTKLKKHHFDVTEHLQKVFADETLEQKIEKSGFLKIPNFLPDEVAYHIYNTLKVSDGWELSLSDDNTYSNDTAHNFLSNVNFPNEQVITRIFRGLLPDKRSAFSAAKYSSSHFIAEHDDKNYQEINGKQYSRSIAIVYYLTPDWKPEYGGILKDLESDTEHVPAFNTLIAFKVPRRHLVTEVTSQERYSIFGWFLEKGALYTIEDDEDDEEKDNEDEKSNEEDDKDNEEGEDKPEEEPEEEKEEE